MVCFQVQDWEQNRTKGDNAKGNLMQAIEFEAQLNEGMIHLPRAYRHWREGQKVKIIVLSNDENQPGTGDNKNNMSCLDMIQEDVGVILNAPEDLSSNPEYLKGYGE